MAFSLGLLKLNLGQLKLSALGFQGKKIERIKIFKLGKFIIIVFIQTPGNDYTYNRVYVGCMDSSIFIFVEPGNPWRKLLERNEEGDQRKEPSNDRTTKLHWNQCS
jgi:hypothetical protein